MAIDARDGSFRVDPARPPDRLDRILRGFRPELSWGAVRDLIRRGKVTVDRDLVKDDGCMVRGGAEVVITVHSRSEAATVEVPPFPRQDVVHCDGDVVVVNKPAGLDTVPYGAATDALDRRLGLLLRSPVRVVHRLDRDTTGVLMFARNAVAEGRLVHQLRQHTVHRRYFAVAHGVVDAGTIRSFLADDRGDGLRGSVRNTALGKEAITHVEVIERLRGATLIACVLETGRTHQIRIHLSEHGHMLLGERAYVREHRGTALPAPRILLHAAELGFLHPNTEKEMRFSAPIPDDMATVIRSLVG